MIERFFTLLAFVIAFNIHTTKAQVKVQEPQDTPAEWSNAYQPFRIAGNLYYVGTYDLACYLITTLKGNILINTGLANSEAVISANIKALGFNLNDTKILLTTQAHYDHMGAMAALKKRTGAKVWVDEADAQVMQDGGASDYALGNGKATYEPVQPDRLLHDQHVVELGGTELVMLHHPGHTKGSCSFLVTVKDDQRSYRVLIANMPTIVTEKHFNEVTKYPNIAKDYAYTLAAMPKLEFDIWVSSHASQFKMHDKHKPGDAYNPMVFADRKGYDKTLAELDKAYHNKLQQK